MKAKEIAARIQANLAVSADVKMSNAVAIELTAEILRLTEATKARSINVGPESDAKSWYRLVGEYNTKWNAVFRLLQDEPRFLWEDGTPRFGNDDFARAVVHTFGKNLSTYEQVTVVDMIVNPHLAVTGNRSFGKLIY